MPTKIDAPAAGFMVAQKIADRFALIPEVEAVALAGSRTAQFADDSSDIDLYVYGREIIPIALRGEIPGDARRSEIGNSVWEPGDEWIDAENGIGIDVMFRTKNWIEDQLARVLKRHEASIGYSTCFWFNIRSSRALFDRSGWFRVLQDNASQPYPDPLKRAIIAKNHPILRNTISSYIHQIELARRRNDPISVNHRTAALLASFFDIVFAVNEQPHPGEKRQLEFAQVLCRNLPIGMADRIRALLASVPDGPVIERANTLLDGLDQFLRDAEEL
jgi:hypothetical protein